MTEEIREENIILAEGSIASSSEDVKAEHEDGVPVVLYEGVDLKGVE